MSITQLKRHCFEDVVQLFQLCISIARSRQRPKQHGINTISLLSKVAVYKVKVGTSFVLNRLLSYEFL